MECEQYQIIGFREATKEKIIKIFSNGLGVMILGRKLPDVSGIIGEFYPVYDNDEKTIISFFGKSSRTAKARPSYG
ncbi:MAG TPA: hypothetical protein PLO44_00910 [Candidatus Paceibacterota bacterium]|nr:hypothetical protein [Candidatus Paceibacterota bacterium]